MAQPLRKMEPEAGSYRERIRELVEADQVKGARALLAEALERGDHGEDLSHWQKVLAPAKTLKIGGELDVDRTPDFRWLDENEETYRGQWVALLHGELLAHAESLDEVLAALERTSRGKRALLHRIY
jgi:uncharacterized protein DUF5678